MNRFTSAVSSAFKRASALALAAIGMVAAGGTALVVTTQNAMAQTGGDFGAAVTGTIDDTKGDVVLIGVAVLAVVVLIAAIAWVSRAINK